MPKEYDLTKAEHGFGAISSDELDHYDGPWVNLYLYDVNVSEIGSCRANSMEAAKCVASTELDMMGLGGVLGELRFSEIVAVFQMPYVGANDE